MALEDMMSIMEVTLMSINSTLEEVYILCIALCSYN